MEENLILLNNTKCKTIEKIRFRKRDRGRGEIECRKYGSRERERNNFRTILCIKRRFLLKLMTNNVLLGPTIAVQDQERKSLGCFSNCQKWSFFTLQFNFLGISPSCQNVHRQFSWSGHTKELSVKLVKKWDRTRTS